MSNFTWNPRLLTDAMSLAGRGLMAAAIFTVNAVKETLSVPAPRIAITDSSGAKYYVAGFKKTQPGWLLSPYAGGSREATATTFKFPKSGPPTASQMSYRTAPAIKGDPPRKLSGNLRRSITYEILETFQTFDGGEVATRVRVGTNVEYAKKLEFGPGRHDFLGRTIRQFRPQIEGIVGQTIEVG